MKKKSVIAINLCLIASIVTLFGNKIYMLYIGDCHQLWEEAQTHYVNRQYEKAREVMTPSIVVETANVNLTIKEFYEQQTWNFSRIPVYDKSKDYIIGYVLKDMVLKELSED